MKNILKFLDVGIRHNHNCVGFYTGNYNLVLNLNILCAYRF